MSTVVHRPGANSQHKPKQKSTVRNKSCPADPCKNVLFHCVVPTALRGLGISDLHGRQHLNLGAVVILKRVPMMISISLYYKWLQHGDPRDYDHSLREHNSVCTWVTVTAFLCP